MALVFVGAFVLIIPLWYLWDWWTEGVLEATEVIALSAVLLVVLGQLAFFRGNPSVQHALFLLLLASAILLPFLSTTFERVADRRLKRTRISEYRGAILRDPANTGARLRLAQTLYSMGKLDEAIAELEAAFQVSKLTFVEERLLADWRDEKRTRDSRSVFCPACGKENQHGSAFCVSCGRQLGRGAAADWARSGGPVAAVRAWALAVFTVLVLLAILAFLPAVPSPNPIIVTCMGFAAWLAFYVISRRNSR